MQLGGPAKINQRQQKETSSLADTLAAEYEDEEDSVGDAWGDGDLMDVNADTDDWSESVGRSSRGGFGLYPDKLVKGAFEAAPTPMEVTRPTTATSVNGSRKTTTTTTASLLRTSTVATREHCQSHRPTSASRCAEFPALPFFLSQPKSKTQTDGVIWSQYTKHPFQRSR